MGELWPVVCGSPSLELFIVFLQNRDKKTVSIQMRLDSIFHRPQSTWIVVRDDESSSARTSGQRNGSPKLVRRKEKTIPLPHGAQRAITFLLISSIQKCGHKLKLFKTTVQHSVDVLASLWYFYRASALHLSQLRKSWKVTILAHMWTTHEITPGWAFLGAIRW